MDPRVDSSLPFDDRDCLQVRVNSNPVAELNSESLPSASLKMSHRKISSPHYSTEKSAQSKCSASILSTQKGQGKPKGSHHHESAPNSLGRTTLSSTTQLVGSMSITLVPSLEGNESNSSVTELRRAKNADPQTLYDRAVGLLEDDDDDETSESVNSGVSSSSWLLEVVSGAFGKSMSPDMESLSAHSNWSYQAKANRTLGGRPRGSEASMESNNNQIWKEDVASMISVAASSLSTVVQAQSGREISSRWAPRRALEHELQQLRKQLASLDISDSASATSSVVVSVDGPFISTQFANSLVTTMDKRKKLVAIVPPGMLGLTLVDRYVDQGLESEVPQLIRFVKFAPVDLLLTDCE
jgi:hypothetical protein